MTYICLNCHKSIPLDNQFMHELRCATINGIRETTEMFEMKTQEPPSSFEIIVYLFGRQHELRDVDSNMNFYEDYVPFPLCDMYGYLGLYNPKPMSRKKIHEIHVVNSDRLETNMPCQICQRTITSNVQFLPCGHHFHQRCMDLWLEMDENCPLHASAVN